MSENPHIDLIVSTTGCTLDEAELAWRTSEDNHAKALEFVELIRTRYLGVKCHFTSNGKQSIEGVFLVLLEDKSPETSYVSAAVINYPEESIEVNGEGDIHYWSQLVNSRKREQSRMNAESSIELEEYIRGSILPDPAFQLWTESRQIKELENVTTTDSTRLLKISDLKKSIERTIRQFVSNYYNLPLQVEAGTELYNNLKFGEIAIALGLITEQTEETEPEAAEPEKKEKLIPEQISVFMKGKMVLDISEGILTKDLKKGDKIAVEIVDRTSIAYTIAQMLGLVEEGKWNHAWGYVRDFERIGTDRSRILIQIAKNVFIETASMNEVRIKCKRKYPMGSRREYVLHSPSSVPSYVMFGGVALFFTIILKIFMVMFNR